MTSKGTDKLVFFKERFSRRDCTIKPQKLRRLAAVIAQDKASEGPEVADDTTVRGPRGTHASAICSVSQQKMVVETKKGPSLAANSEVIDLRGFSSDGEEKFTPMKVAGRKSAAETKNMLRNHLGRKSKETDMGAAQSGQKKANTNPGAEKPSSKSGGVKPRMPAVQKSTDGAEASVQKNGSQQEEEGVKRGPGRPRKEEDIVKLGAGKAEKVKETQKRASGRGKKDKETKMIGPSKATPAEEGLKREGEKLKPASETGPGGKTKKPESEKGAEGKVKKEVASRDGVQEKGLGAVKGKPANKASSGSGSVLEKLAGESAVVETVGLKRKGEKAMDGVEKEAKRSKGELKEQLPSKGATDGNPKGGVVQEAVGGSSGAAKASGKGHNKTTPSGHKKGGVRAAFETLKTLRGPKPVESSKKGSPQEPKEGTQLVSGGRDEQGKSAAADSDGRRNSEATESDEDVIRRGGAGVHKEGDPSAKGVKAAVLKSSAEAQPKHPSMVGGVQLLEADRTTVAINAARREEGKEGQSGLQDGPENEASGDLNTRQSGAGADAQNGGQSEGVPVIAEGGRPEQNHKSTAADQAAGSNKEPAEGRGSGEVDTLPGSLGGPAQEHEAGVKSVGGRAAEGALTQQENAVPEEATTDRVSAESEPASIKKAVEVGTGGSELGAETGVGEAGSSLDEHRSAVQDEKDARDGDLQEAEKGMPKEGLFESGGKKVGDDSALRMSGAGRGQGAGRGSGEIGAKEAETEQEGPVSESPGAEDREEWKIADADGSLLEAGDAKSSGDEKENGAESSGDEKAHGTRVTEEEGRGIGDSKKMEPVPEKMATRGLGKRERVPVRRILEEEEPPQRASRLGSTKQADKNASRIKNRYRCEICGAVFANGQALGGHKGSHKAMEGFTEEDKLGNAKKGTRAPLQKGQKNPNSAEVTKELPVDPAVKVWTCEVCGLVFPNGQALGGHKGSHKSYYYTALEKPPPQPSTFRSTRLQRRSEERSAADKVTNDDEEDSMDGAGTPRAKGEGAFVKRLSTSLRPKDRLQSLAAIVSKKSRRIVSVDEEDRKKSSKWIAERLRRTADGTRKRTETSGALSPTGQSAKGMDSFEEDAVAGLMVLRQPITLQVERQPDRNRRKRAQPIGNGVPGARKSDDTSTLEAAKVLVGKNGLLDAAPGDSDGSDADLTASDEYEDADAAFSSGDEKSGREERRLLRTVPGGRQSPEPTDKARRPETRTKEERRATRKVRGSSDEEDVWRPRIRERGPLGNGNGEPKRTQGGEKKQRARPPRTGLLSEMVAREGSVSSKENDGTAGGKAKETAGLRKKLPTQGKGSGDRTGGEKTEATAAKEKSRGLGKEGKKKTGDTAAQSDSSDEPLAGAFHRKFSSGKCFGGTVTSPEVSPMVLPRRDTSSPTPYIIPIMEEAEAVAEPQEPSDEEELLPLSALKAGKKEKKTPVYGPGSRVHHQDLVTLIMRRNTEQCAIRDKREKLGKAEATQPTQGFKVPGLVTAKPGLVSKGLASTGLEGDETAESKKRRRREDVNGAEKTKKRLLGGEEEGAESRNGSPLDGGTNVFSLGMRRPLQPPSYSAHELGEFLPEINAQMVMDFLKGVESASKGPAEKEAQNALKAMVGLTDIDSGDEDAPIGLLSKFRSPEKRAREMHPPERELPEKRPVDKTTAVGGTSLAGPAEGAKKSRKRQKKSDGGASGVVLALPAGGGSNASDPGSLTEQNSASETEDLPIGRRASDAPAANPVVAGYTEINRGKATSTRPFLDSGLDLEEEIQKAVRESIELIQHYKMSRKLYLKGNRVARKKRKLREEAEARFGGDFQLPEDEVEGEGNRGKLKSKRSKEKALFRSLETPSPEDPIFLDSLAPPRDPNPVHLGAPPDVRPRHVSSSVNDFLEKLGIKDFVDKAWPPSARPSSDMSGRPSETAPRLSDGLRFRSEAPGQRPGESDRPLADFVGIPPVRPSYTVLTEEEELEHALRPKLTADELSNAYRALKSAVEAGRPRPAPEREQLDLNTGLSLGGTPQAAPLGPAPFLQMLREGGTRPPGTPAETGRGPELGAYFRDKGVVKNGKWLPMKLPGEKGEVHGREHRGLEVSRGDETALWSRTELRGQPDLPLVKTGLAQFLGRGAEERPGGAPKAGLARPSSHEPTQERPLLSRNLDLNLGAALPARTAPPAPPASLPGSPLIAPVWKSISDRELLSREWELPNWLPANLDGTRNAPPSKRPYAPPRFNPRDQTGVSGPSLFNGPQPNVWKDKDGPRDRSGVSGPAVFDGLQRNGWKDKNGNGSAVLERAWPELLKQKQEGIHSRGDGEPAAVLKGRDERRRPSPGFLELRVLGDAVQDGPLFSEQEILETRARGMGLGGLVSDSHAPGSLQQRPGPLNPHLISPHVLKSAETLRRLLGKNESLTSPAIRSFAEGVNKMVQEGSKLLPDPKPRSIPNLDEPIHTNRSLDEAIHTNKRSLDEPIHTNERSLNGAPAGFPVRSTAPTQQPESVTEDRANWAKVTSSNLPGWLATEVEKRRKGE